MFGKLRIKLALLNAAVAGLIILAIAMVAYVLIAQAAARQSEQVLMMIAGDLEAADQLGSIGPADLVQAIRGSYPYLVLRVDATGSLVFADYQTRLSPGQMTELAGRAFAKERQFFDGLAKGAARTDKPVTIRRPRSAIVSLAGGQSFRYSISGRRMGATSFYMIFLDMRQEQALMAGVRLALLGSVLGGLVLTMLGGLFLAGRALRPVRTAWQKQRNFVADASHELRSPLAAIRCNLDVVLDDPSAPVADKQLYWEGISEETGRMTVLVDELLLLARADSDAVVLQKERVLPAEQACAAVAFLQPLAARKNIGLTVEAPDSPAVLGDPARLKQVLIALIDNAIKYTPAGGQVSVGVKKTRDRAVIEVEDTGIGIAKEHIDKIFERFYRVDKARERESGGHGLGLSIAQWIVQQMGGSISVESQEGRGSCFAVTLPLMKE